MGWDGMGFEGHVGLIGDRRNKKILSQNLKGRDNLEDLRIDGRIILEWIKMEVNLSLSLTKQHSMKVYWGGGIAPCIDLGPRRR
jgi:hypothetical protein